MVKTVRMNIVLPKWLKESLKIAAEAKGISMTSYILDAIKEKFEREKH